MTLDPIDSPTGPSPETGGATDSALRGPLGDGALRSRKRFLEGARLCLAELEWDEDAAETWLADSWALAQLPLGSVAFAAGQDAQDGGSAVRLGAQVYRELEVVERQLRADLLSEVAARLARQAATLGAAGISLLVPFTPQSRAALIERLQREGRRGKSERLHRALRSLQAPLSSETCEPDGPGTVAEALCQAARLLWPSAVTELIEAEVALAYGNAALAKATVVGLIERLPGGADEPASGGDSEAGAQDGAEPVDGEGAEDPAAEADAAVEPRVETPEEAALRERCRRVLALVHFGSEEPVAALECLNSLPLVLDRSASIGAIRAAAEYRARLSQAPGWVPQISRDEFKEPVDADERRRVARFLALAHSVDNQPDSRDNEGRPPVREQ